MDPAGVGAATQVAPALPSALVDAARELDLPESELALGVELAHWLPAPLPGFLYVVAALRLAQRRGSTRLPLTGRGLEAHLDDLGAPDEARAAAETMRIAPQKLAPVVGEPGDHRPLLVVGDHLHAQRLHALETRLAADLSARVVGGPALAPAADAVLADPDLGLTEEQRAAVRAAATGRLTLISGEPGTGKTSIVRSLLRVLHAAGFGANEVALAAPTGKAADRMRASLLGERGPRWQTSTLHRLLGYSPRLRRFRHHERNPLQQRVVIVDESSMIDVALLDALVRALAPDTPERPTQLVLLGDAHQLPSVDAGAAFRDLCAFFAESPRAPTLTRSFRMDPDDPAGSHVLQVAREIDRGDVPAVFETLGDAPTEGGVTHDERDLESFLAGWWSEDAVDEERLGAFAWDPERGFDEAARARLERCFARFERRRILCLTRGRETGALALNEQLHRRHRERTGAPPVPFAIGEPVLVTRNDYARGLFNGDQGFVAWVAGRARAVFRREADGSARFVAFPLVGLAGRLELAHALTVHKAQGSEHDEVAVVLPSENIPLLTRELLYTAVTRARRVVHLVGPRASLEAGIERRIERSSALGDWMA